MRTLAEAAVLAAFCGLVWLPVRALTRRSRHAVAQVLLYATAAVMTTGASVALGAWQEDRRPDVVSVAATFGGMCAFWALVRLQTGRARPDHDLVEHPPAVPSTTASASSTTAATDDTALPTMTRRERREARHRFGGVRRRQTTVLR